MLFNSLKSNRVMVIFYCKLSLPWLSILLAPYWNFLWAVEQGRKEIIFHTLSLLASWCRTGRKRACFCFVIKNPWDAYKFLLPLFNRASGEVPLFVLLTIRHLDARCSLGWYRLGGVKQSLNSTGLRKHAWEQAADGRDKQAPLAVTE